MGVDNSSWTLGWLVLMFNQCVLLFQVLYVGQYGRLFPNEKQPIWVAFVDHLELGVRPCADWTSVCVYGCTLLFILTPFCNKTSGRLVGAVIAVTVLSIAIAQLVEFVQNEVGQLVNLWTAFRIDRTAIPFIIQSTGLPLLLLYKMANSGTVSFRLTMSSMLMLLLLCSAMCGLLRVIWL